MGIYYISGIPFGDELYHYRTKGSKNGVSTTPGYKAIGQLADATQYAANRVRYLRDRTPELVKATTTKDSKEHFIVKPKTISDLYTGEHHKRAAENDRRHISTQFRKTVKDLEKESYNGGSKQMGELVRKYGDATARIYGSERDWSIPGIKKLREDANWNLQQYENAPRQRINRAVSSGKEWAKQTVKSAEKGFSKTYGDASKWVNQAVKDAKSAPKKAYDAVSNQDELQALRDFAKKHYNEQTQEWDSVDNALEFQRLNAEYFNHPITKGSRELKALGKDISNVFDSAQKWVGQAGKDVGDFTTKTAKDIGDWGKGAIDSGKKFIENVDISDVKKVYGDASKWVSQAGKDVGKTATKAYNDASKWAGNAAKDVGKAASKAGKAVESGAKSAVNAGKKAAKDIGDWGGKQLKKGKKFLKSIFG